MHGRAHEDEMLRSMVLLGVSAVGLDRTYLHPTASATIPSA